MLNACGRAPAPLLPPQEKADWETAKRLLGESGFIRRLVELDKDNIGDRVLRALQRVVSDPSFTPELVGSGPCTGRAQTRRCCLDLPGAFAALPSAAPDKPAWLPIAAGGQAVQGRPEHVPLGARHGHLRPGLQGCRAQEAGAGGSAGGAGRHQQPPGWQEGAAGRHQLKGRPMLLNCCVIAIPALESRQAAVFGR